MGKYYARTEPVLDNYEWEALLDSDMMEHDHIAIWGESRSVEINGDMVSRIEGWLEDLRADNESLENDDGMSDEDRFEEGLRNAQYYFGGTYGVQLSKSQRLKLIRMAAGLDYAVDDDDRVKVLGIIYGEEFECMTIRGSGQGEWNKLWIPKRLAHEAEYIESCYFGLGCYVQFTNEPVESTDEYDSYDDMFDSVGYDTVYSISDWRGDAEKAVCDCLRCKPEDIEWLD